MHTYVHIYAHIYAYMGHRQKHVKRMSKWPVWGCAQKDVNKNVPGCPEDVNTMAKQCPRTFVLHFSGILKALKVFIWGRRLPRRPPVETMRALKMSKTCPRTFFRHLFDILWAPGDIFLTFFWAHPQRGHLTFL